MCVYMRKSVIDMSSISDPVHPCLLPARHMTQMEMRRYDLAGGVLDRALQGAFMSALWERWRARVLWAMDACIHERTERASDIDVWHAHT